MAKTRQSRGSPKERGAITPILAACLAVGLGLLAMTVDLGQLFVAKNELQNIADAAALAGAKKLVQAKDPSTSVAAVYCSEAIAAAQAVAADNKSLGTTLTIADADVTVGQWNLSTGSFTKTGCSANPVEVTAIQVTVKRDGEINPSVASFFGGLLGTPSVNSQATAVAYLGVAGTAASGTLGLPFAVSSNPSGAFPGVASRSVRTRSYARANSILDWFMPQPANATGSVVSCRWKDTGGSTLDTTKGTFIMPNNSERTDLGQLQRYIKGPNGGGDSFPKSAPIQVGQKVYPISEYQWQQNVLDNFTYLKSRFTSEKAANGKWRTTVAVYYKDKPSAELQPLNTWLGLAQSLLGPKPAYACMSYTSPVSYVEGFITVDVTNVTVGPSSGKNKCTNFNYDDSRSCVETSYMDLEIPVDQNFVTPGTNSNPVPGQTTQEMNPNAPTNAGNFAAVPYLVK
jgi:Flp pilus assembly protein TadG